jgi:hypothetical protein
MSDDPELVTVEVIAPHRYPYDGPVREVGERYALPAVFAESLLGMGVARLCPHPDHDLPGTGRPGVHPEPHRGAHPDHDLPEREPRPRPKAKG